MQLHSLSTDMKRSQGVDNKYVVILIYKCHKELICKDPKHYDYKRYFDQLILTTIPFPFHEGNLPN